MDQPDAQRFREYTPADLAGALAVFDSNVPAFFTPGERAAFEAFLRDLPGPYFVVEAGHSIVACGGYAIVATESRADLCWGMVDRALHGRGIGRRLAEFRIGAARQDPRVREVILNTSQHTRAFYEKLGFVTEQFVKDGFAPGLDRCDMRLRLRQAGGTGPRNGGQSQGAGMSDPIVYIDTSDIRDGKLERLRTATKELSAFVEANNPHILSYRFFVDEDAGRMTVVAVHPDSEALEYHMDVGGAEFRKFADLLELVSIVVYGDVDDAVLERLNRKAEMLGRGRVTVCAPHAGFSR